MFDLLYGQCNVKNDPIISHKPKVYAFSIDHGITLTSKLVQQNIARL